MSNIKDRITKYINGVEQKLKEIEVGEGTKLLDLIKQYVEDSKYYMEKGDLETALVDVAYAEGLLDAFLILSGRDPGSNVSKKVFVGGTFDIIHPGHIYFLREASRLGRVYVAVARDVNVKKFKGREPINDEKHRLEVIRSIRYVYEAFLGDEQDIVKSVERVRPDVILLGPDQKVNEEALSSELKSRGLNPEVLRLRERVKSWKHSSTTALIQTILQRYGK